MTDSKIAWLDRPIESLTREQLLEALLSAYRRIEQLKDERDALQRRIFYPPAED